MLFKKIRSINAFFTKYLQKERGGISDLGTFDLYCRRLREVLPTKRGGGVTNPTVRNAKSLSSNKQKRTAQVGEGENFNGKA